MADQDLDTYADAVRLEPRPVSIARALEMADELGIEDAYTFAELAVWDLEVYGCFDDPADEGPDFQTELESVWLEAENQWRRHVANRDKT